MKTSFFPGGSRTLVVLRRGLALTLTTGVLLGLSAGAATAQTLALTRDDGDDPGPSLNAFQTMGLFVGIPLLIAAVLGILVYASSLTKGPRYRPGWAWWHDSVWFSGPAGEEMRLVETGVGATPRAATLSGGGASARW